MYFVGDLDSNSDNANDLGSWNRYVLDNVMFNIAIHKYLHGSYIILSPLFSPIPKRFKVKTAFKKPF